MVEVGNRPKPPGAPKDTPPARHPALAESERIETLFIVSLSEELTKPVAFGDEILEVGFGIETEPQELLLGERALVCDDFGNADPRAAASPSKPPGPPERAPGARGAGRLRPVGSDGRRPPPGAPRS